MPDELDMKMAMNVAASAQKEKKRRNRMSAALFTTEFKA
jgi:hypothetical protein